MLRLLPTRVDLLRPRRLRRRDCRLQLEALESRDVPSYLGNPVFPADNPWNQKVADAPVAANSATLIAAVGASRSVHPDFGQMLWEGGLIGIPFNVVSGDQAKVSVVLDAYADESDPVAAPIPANAVIEGDPLASADNTGDRHLIVYDKDNNIDYEFFNVHRPSETSDHQWHADAEAVWHFNENAFRTPGYTSADAAGLPILPGLVRPDEVLDQGKIDHAIRVTVPGAAASFIYPASHLVHYGASSDPRMGERFRLKQSFDISSFSPANQVILQAMKDYGLIVADIGSGWYISGEPSSRWDDSDLHDLGRVKGSDFEAINLTPRVTGFDHSGGSVAGGQTVVINGLNFSGAAGLTRVFFGDAEATGVTVLSDTQIQVTTPAHAAATVDVSVHSPYGPSATTSADQFTFVETGPQPGHFQFTASTFDIGETAGSLTVTVVRTGGSAGEVGVDFASADGSATAGSDYTAVSGTLTFADGETSQTITVPIEDDTLVEGKERFSLTLSNPSGGADLGSPNSATVSILDDEIASPGVLQFSAPYYQVSEGVGKATITVTRTGGSLGSVAVHYFTRNGTARARADYTATAGTLVFADGETSQTFTVTIRDDARVEALESIRLYLNHVTGGARLGIPRISRINILDNDVRAGAPSRAFLQAGPPAIVNTADTWPPPDDHWRWLLDRWRVYEEIGI